MAALHIEGSSSSTNIKLDCAYLGHDHSKEPLYLIELSIQLGLAVATSGGFLRYMISQKQGSQRTCGEHIQGDDVITEATLPEEITRNEEGTQLKG